MTVPEIIVMSILVGYVVVFYTVIAVQEIRDRRKAGKH